MFVKQTTSQLISPLSNTYLFEFGNIPEEDQDLMKKLSMRALNMIYTYTSGRVITETSFDIYLDANELSDSIRLPVRPILEITSVTSYNNDNESTVLDPSNYYCIEGDHILFITGDIGSVRGLRSVKLSLKAGYDPVSLPSDILSAIEQLTVFLYENRGDTDTLDIPLSIRLALDPYVIHRF